MKDFTVRVGGFYVNERKYLVREITNRDSDGYVHWRSYFLDDGRATGDNLKCFASQIVRWADREATPQEVARMNSRDAQRKERDRVIGFVDKVLKHIPDDQLFAEVLRRGHRVI